MAKDQKDMTLEEMITDCAERGELVHISLTACPSGNQFSASYGCASGFGITITYDKDPVKCLRDAIVSTKLRRRATVERPEARAKRATAE